MGGIFNGACAPNNSDYALQLYLEKEEANDNRKSLASVCIFIGKVELS